MSRGLGDVYKRQTLIGSKVAALLSAKFIDGDDLHPAKNIDKMSQGIPLSDEDRLPWLERLNDASYSLYKKNETGFIVCSSSVSYTHLRAHETSQDLV
ncbi:nucleoside/nucleotide kinase family protein, partial [Escherichia coli]